jgi:hypothetical protein
MELIDLLASSLHMICSVQQCDVSFAVLVATNANFKKSFDCELLSYSLLI